MSDNTTQPEYITVVINLGRSDGEGAEYERMLNEVWHTQHLANRSEAGRFCIKQTFEALGLTVQEA